MYIYLKKNDGSLRSRLVEEGFKLFIYIAFLYADFTGNIITLAYT